MPIQFAGLMASVSRMGSFTSAGIRTAGGALEISGFIRPAAGQLTSGGIFKFAGQRLQVGTILDETFGRLTLRGRIFGQDFATTLYRKFTGGSYGLFEYLKYIIKVGSDRSTSKPDRGGLRGLNKQLNSDLKNASANFKPVINVDTSNFDKAIKEYLQYSRKDYQTIVNKKAFDVAANAVRFTYKADKEIIKNELEKPSDKMKGLTVAEALIVNSYHKKKEKVPKNLKQLARKMINNRKRAAAFLRSGWLPAIRSLAPFVQKEVKDGLTRSEIMVSKTLRGKPKGFAIPSHSGNSDRASSTIANSIIADNNPKARAYMEKGLQESLNYVARDMMAYVEKKMTSNAERFNRR